VLTAGSQTLSVTFTPTDTTDYTTASTSVQLTVNKATPVITWTNPASILYGTPLSTTQLNATANVPGTFVYSPAAGTVLAAGNQTLSVTFTPADTTDYTTAVAQVTLLVTQPLISFSPSSINLGTTVRFGTSVSATVIVSNPGTAPLQISKIALAGNDEDNDLFHFTNNCTAAVPPGGNCNFMVKFNASETGPFAMTILVTGSSGHLGEALMRTLREEGRPAPQPR
jgi:hypothetical protein